MKTNGHISTQKNPNTSFSSSLWVKPLYSPNRESPRPSSSGRRTVYVQPTEPKCKLDSSNKPVVGIKGIYGLKACQKKKYSSSDFNPKSQHQLFKPVPVSLDINPRYTTYNNPNSKSFDISSINPRILNNKSNQDNLNVSVTSYKILNEYIDSNKITPLETLNYTHNCMLKESRIKNPTVHSQSPIQTKRKMKIEITIPPTIAWDDIDKLPTPPSTPSNSSSNDSSPTFATSVYSSSCSESYTTALSSEPDIIPLSKQYSTPVRQNNKVRPKSAYATLNKIDAYRNTIENTYSSFINQTKQANRSSQNDLLKHKQTQFKFSATTKTTRMKRKSVI